MLGCSTRGLSAAPGLANRWVWTRERVEECAAITAVTLNRELARRRRSVRRGRGPVSRDVTPIKKGSFNPEARRGSVLMFKKLAISCDYYQQQ